MNTYLISPLDCILFRGKDYISKFVEEMENLSSGFNDFSHVGIVITSEILPCVKNLKPNILYIWESTSSLCIPGCDTQFVPDVELGTTRFGVQIRELDKVLKAYDGSVYWAKLKVNPWLKRNILDGGKEESIIKTLETIHEKLGKAHYELNPISLFSATITMLRPIRNCIDFSIIVLHKITNMLRLTSGSLTQLDVEEFSVFCSEFVSIIYINLGILEITCIPYDITPVNLIHEFHNLLNKPLKIN